MTPEEVAEAAADARAKAAPPIHSGRFAIARHAWDDPSIRLERASLGRERELWTPIIGEPVDLGAPGHSFTRWWVGR